MESDYYYFFMMISNSGLNTKVSFTVYSVQSCTVRVLAIIGFPTCNYNIHVVYFISLCCSIGHFKN